MRGEFLPQFSEHKDQTYAFHEILHYCYTMEIDGASRSSLSAAMLNAALEVMDYIDPLDFTRNLESDAGNNRLMRLSNFFDYLRDYADKRYALLDEQDKMIEKKLQKYKGTRTTVRVLEGRAIRNDLHLKALPSDEIAALITELQDNLLIQGIERQMLARAFIDASFIYAKLAGEEFYKQICIHIHGQGRKASFSAQKAFKAFIESANPEQKRPADSELQGIVEEYGAYISTAIH